MVKIYSSDNISLKIETMSKKTHFFYENGGEIPIGDLTVSKKDETIKLMSYERDDEKAYEKMAACYNKFIHANPKFGHYELTVVQESEKSIYEPEENFPFVIYAIKKSLNSPINLVTKEQIDELDKHGISYYNYYNADSIRGLSHHNKNILMDISKPILISSNDSFKDCVLNVYLPNQKKHDVDYRDIRATLTIEEDYNSGKLDRNDYIYVPEVNVLDRDKNGHMKEVPCSKKTNDIFIKNESSKLPLNLSNIKESKITLKIFVDKETVLKTLETLNDKENKTIVLNKSYFLPYRDKELKCNELINCLSEEIIKYTANRDNGLK